MKLLIKFHWHAHVQLTILVRTETSPDFLVQENSHVLIFLTLFHSLPLSLLPTHSLSFNTFSLQSMKRALKFNISMCSYHEKGVCVIYSLGVEKFKLILLNVTLIFATFSLPLSLSLIHIFWLSFSHAYLQSLL